MRAPARTEGLLLTGLLDDLRRIVRVLRESSRASEGRLGVAGAQLFVLKSLSSSEPLCLNDVAVLTRTHQSTASVVIERLVERGLVQRLELSPARRRVLAETLHELVAANDARLPVAPSLGPALAAAHMSPRRVLVDGRVAAISGISVAIALTAGFVAQALTALIGLFTNLAFYGRLSTAFVSPTAHRLGPLVVAVPVAGGLVVGLMARYGSQAIRGHGIPDAMEQVLVPVSAVLLAVEPLLLEYRPRSLIPVALAAAAATAVRIAFVGAEPAFAMPELQSRAAQRSPATR